MRILCFVFLFLILNSATAQELRPRFSSAISAGLAAGEDTHELIIESINGIAFSGWFAGVGVGIDYYRYKTLPLFANGKWYFDSLNRAFIYGSLGYSFPLKNKPGREMGNYTGYDFSGGIYTGAGIGYAFPLGRKSALEFSVGYSYKEVRASTIMHICPFVPPCYDDTYQFELNYGRIAIKAGIRL